jgi:hypothetical protein
MNSRDLVSIALAPLGSVFCGYEDMRTTEVTSTFVVLLFWGLVLGLVHPRRFWLFAFVIGLGVPLMRVAGPSVGIIPSESDHSGGILGLLAIGAITVLSATCGAFTGARFHELYGIVHKPIHAQQSTKRAAVSGC